MYVEHQQLKTLGANIAKCDIPYGDFKVTEMCVFLGVLQSCVYPSCVQAFQKVFIPPI